MDSLVIDVLDRAILAELRIDGRASWRELGERVGLGPTATADRVRRLERHGVIRGYHAQVADPAGSGVKAFLELFYKDGRCQDYVERMRAYPEIRQCCGISVETDMLVQVEAASMARLAEIRGVIEGFPGMQRVKTHMVVNEWAM